MTTQSRAILKSFFEKGDRPTQQNFIDVFDSTLNLRDGGVIQGSTRFAGNITASNISASGLIMADSFQSTGGNVAGISFLDDTKLEGNLTASGDISSSGVISSSGLLVDRGTPQIVSDSDEGQTKRCFSEVCSYLGTMTVGNTTTIRCCTTVMNGHNAALWVSNYNPSITIIQGVEYSILDQADVIITNFNLIPITVE